MLFSIITICYNNEADIAKTLDSVLAQDYSGEVEYIIKDGASKDGTAAIAESYRERFEQKGYSFRVISEPDKGIYDAMNAGIKSAKGEIIGMINAGDWYEKNALSAVAETYAKTPFDMFYADINLVKENGSIIVKHSKIDRYPSSRNWNHPTTFITRKTYEECGLYRNNGVHDDYDLVLRVRRAGKKVVVKNEILANFAVGGASNQRSLKKSMERIRSRYSCYSNNGYSKLYIIECLMMEAAKFILC